MVTGARTRRWFCQLRAATCNAGIIQGMSRSPGVHRGQAAGSGGWPFGSFQRPDCGRDPFQRMIKYVRSSDRHITAESKQGGTGGVQASAVPALFPLIDGLSDRTYPPAAWTHRWPFRSPGRRWRWRSRDSGGRGAFPHGALRYWANGCTTGHGARCPAAGDGAESSMKREIALWFRGLRCWIAIVTGDSTCRNWFRDPR